MSVPDLQDLCDLGQQLLTSLRYADAAQTLAEAEKLAWYQRDFDTLSRLYLPLQEARRQSRLRCAEGVVRLDILARGPDDLIDPENIVAACPAGQLLVAGWNSIQPAVQVRTLARQRRLYLETFLGAVYPTPQGRIVVVAPLEDAQMPAAPEPSQLESLHLRLPPNCLILTEDQIPRGHQPGSAQTAAQVLALWEGLHRPYLDQAEAQPDPVRRIEAYRTAIRVDYACELAHQRICDLARILARTAAESSLHMSESVQ